MPEFVLEILDGDRAGEVVSLGAEPLRIGRKPANDLVIADEKASGVHAEVVPEEGRFVLRDLGSTNGTLMEGRKVSEVVLSGGDTFLVGRVRLRFRAVGEEAAPAGLELGRLDTSRLAGARSSRPVGLLVVLLVAALSAGGYVWWRGQGGGGGESRGAAGGPPAPLRVAGNRLPEAQGACETEEGWDLRLAGRGFRATGRAHTGTGAFTAARQADAGAAEGGGESAGEDFAIASAAPRQVASGRALTVAAHLRTGGAARAAVRMHFFASGGAASIAAPFHFRTGAALAEYADWTRVTATAAVPDGADRCSVEIVAVLPGEGSEVSCDDVALVEEGSAEAVRQKLDDAPATVVATGPSFALRSVDPEQPVTLQGIAPVPADAALAGLHAAGLLTLSDVGASLRHEVDARSCTVAVEGCAAIQLRFPVESAAGLMVEGEDGFASAAASFGAVTRRVLLGDRSTRCLVELDSAGAVEGSAHGGSYRLQLPGTRCRFVLGFLTERREALDLLDATGRAAAENRPGAALLAVRELAARVPFDLETLTQALARRGRLLEEQAERLRRIAVELEEAEFFETRGGFARVVEQLDELRSLYGAENLTDPDAVAALRERAAARLASLEQREDEAVRERLVRMQEAFDQTAQPDLARLVRDYVEKHLK